MLRYEAKHQQLKEYTSNTKNFKNINKSVALKHQEMLALKKFTYVDAFSSGVMTKPNDTLKFYISNNLYCSCDSIQEIDWFRYNHFEYRKNFMIIFGHYLHQIQNILVIDGKKYFLTYKCRIESFDSYLHSFKIEEINNSELILIDFNSLKYFKTHEIQKLNQTDYIIIENLEMVNSLHLN